MKELEMWWKDHFDEFLDDFRRIISIPSVSVEDKGNAECPYGQPCVDVLHAVGDIARRFGFEYRIDSNQYGLLIWPGRSDKTIGLFSHMDVVPTGPGWTYPPFELTALDDILIGRGTGDNKGPALAVIYALRYLKETGYQPEHTITQFFGVNEECGMEDIKFYAKRNPMPEFSLIPDSSFPVCYGEKGILEIDADRQLGKDTAIISWKSGVASNSVPALAEAELRIDAGKLSAAIRDERVTVTEGGNGTSRVEAHGIAAHAAFPEGSESAQNILASALLSSKLFPESDNILFQDILSLFSDYNGKGIGVPYEDDISGKLTHVGGFSSVSDGVFHQNINIRYTITAVYDRMIASITDTLKGHGFSIEAAEGSLPMYVERSLPIIDKLTSIANEALGMDLKPYVMGGGTYARQLRNAVGFGPGIPGDSDHFGPERGRGHQPDEYISRRKLSIAFSVYVSSIPEVDGFFKV